MSHKLDRLEKILIFPIITGMAIYIGSQIRNEEKETYSKIVHNVGAACAVGWLVRYTYRERK